MAKPKASKNKAKDTEKSQKLQKLWAAFGQTSARIDQLKAQLQLEVQRAQEIYKQIKGENNG